MIIKTRKTNAGYAQLVLADRHTLVTDVNAAVGGADIGPSPHDIFDMSLAACTALTLSMYAERKKLPLADFSVEVESDRSQGRQGEYHFTRRLHFGNELTSAQRDELLAIANKCPLHKLMTEVKVVIDTKLAE